jgi:hypothetical protein
MLDGGARSWQLGITKPKDKVSNLGMNIQNSIK